MTTPTEPAARLTVADRDLPDGTTQRCWLVECVHGAAGVFGESFPIDLYYVRLDTMNDLMQDISTRMERMYGCHCADAIRARYGAGGEGER